MSDVLLSALFQSKTRVTLVDLLFCQGITGSVSELARRGALSPRSIAREVENLRGVGLVSIEACGGLDLVTAIEGPAAEHLRALFELSVPPSDRAALRESLAWYGAPLEGVRPRRHLGFEETIAGALDAARTNGLILRVLPVVMAKNPEPNWSKLRSAARHKKVGAELGMLIELTADLLERPDWRVHAASLRDRRRRRTRYYPRVGGRFEEQLAVEHTPPAARRWGFLMNMPEESFRDLLVRHHAATT